MLEAKRYVKHLKDEKKKKEKKNRKSVIIINRFEETLKYVTNCISKFEFSP